MKDDISSELKEKILSVIGGGDILVIVPPFASINDTALGPQVIHAAAREKGYKADLLYLNILLASVIGVEHYGEIYSAPLHWMMGERLFARSAYGLPPLGKNPEVCADEAMAVRGHHPHAKMFYEPDPPFELERYLQTEEICFSFMESITPVLTSMNYKIIGCTSGIIGQTNCGVALLDRIKKLNPGIATLMGGFNCESEMAKGIGSLSSSIDYIFSGESETSFLDFLKGYFAQQPPRERIIYGKPLADLDTFPLADYKVFFDQSACFLGEHAPRGAKPWYETSRGCWYAHKVKCTFCGVPLNTGYRQKSVDKVVDDLKRIKKVCPDNLLCMTDIIMPNSYHKELLPLTGNKEEFPVVFYQLRANLALSDLVNLKKARIQAILPGIEALSTHLLKLMKKGVTNSQNILLLRNARSLDIYVEWLMLWGFPGDSVTDYEEILALLPLIRHLQPPVQFTPMVFLRYSAYFNDPRAYGIENLRPWAVTDMIYPPWADIENLVYYYIGECPCEALDHPEIIREIARETAQWRKTWKQTKLEMNHVFDQYIIYDNREFHEKEKTHFLDYHRAKEIMTPGVYTGSRDQEWAVTEKLGIVVDSRYIPLVTAPLSLLSELKKEGEVEC